MTERYVPLSVRTSDEPDAIQSWSVLQQGIPEHLRTSVDTWIHGVVSEYGKVLGVCQRTLRYAVPDRMSERDALWRYARESNVNTLDVLDLMIHYLSRVYEKHENSPSAHMADDAIERVRGLVQILHEANSAWAVTTEPRWGLTQVVDATATRAFEDVRDVGSDASRLMAQAWEATFRQHPDYSAAYSRVVQAVETVALPVLASNDKAATLGKAINNLRTAQSQWTVSALDDKSQESSGTLLAMLQTVWQNHQRHASHDGRAPEPAQRDETEAVLFLAITIVQWFQRGFVRRVDGV